MRSARGWLNDWLRALIEGDLVDQVHEATVRAVGRITSIW